MTSPRECYWLVRVRLGRKPNKTVQWGPLTPAAIIRLQTRHEPGEASNAMDRSPYYAAFLAGEPIDLIELWALQMSTEVTTRRIIQIDRVLTRREYERLLGEIAGARRADRYLPMAVPFQPVRADQVEIPFLSGVNR